MKLFRISNPRLHENIFIAIKDLYHPRVGDKFVVAPSSEKQPVLVCELVEEIKPDSKLRPDIFGVGFVKLMDLDISDPRLASYSKKLKEANRKVSEITDLITKHYSSDALNNYKLPEINFDAVYSGNNSSVRYFRNVYDPKSYRYMITNSDLDLDDSVIVVNGEVLEEVSPLDLDFSYSIIQIDNNSAYQIIPNSAIYNNRKLARELNTLRYLLGNEFYKIVDIHSYVR